MLSRSCVAWILVLAGAASLMGCGPSQPGARLERMDPEGGSPLTGPVVSLSDEEIVQLVQEHESPDGTHTVMDWLQQELSNPQGQPLFPRWTVQRHGASRYEVRFNYTWIDRSNQIELRAYAWQVDGALRTVQGPQKIETESTTRVRSLSAQQERRVSDPDYSLR